MLDGSDEEWDEHESDEETSWSGLRQQRELGQDGRLVVHFDVDAFYVACERRRNTALIGQPVAITQYNRGGFVAVSYEAKAQGIRKGDGIGERGQKELDFFKNRPEAVMTEVMKRCPELIVLSMDMPYYRQVSQAIARELSSVCGTVMTNSIDDFYVLCPEHVDEARLSLPDPSHVYVYPDSSPVAISSLPPPFRAAAHLAQHARHHVSASLRLTLSAGVACNKLMARLTSPLHKPDALTVLLPQHVATFIDSVPVLRVPGLQAQRGRQVVAMVRPLKGDQNSVRREWTPVVNSGAGESREGSMDQGEDGEGEQEEVVTMGHVRRALTKEALVSAFGEGTGTWIFEAAQGQDRSPVFKRPPPSTLITEASFNGATTVTQIKVHASLLCAELLRRLQQDKEEHKRAPQLLVVRYRNEYSTMVSRSCRLPHGTVKYICAYSRSPPEHLDTIPAIASAGSPAASQQDNEATDTLAEAVLALLSRCLPPAPYRITRLVIGASNFQSTADQETSAITRFFAATQDRKPSSKESPLAKPGSGDANTRTDMKVSQSSTLHDPLHQSIDQAPTATGPELDDVTRKLLEAAGYDEAVFRALPSDVRREVLAAAQQATSRDTGSIRQASPGSGGRGGGKAGWSKRKRRAEGAGQKPGAMDAYLKRPR